MLPVLCGKLKTSTSTSFNGAHCQEYGAKLSSETHWFCLCIIRSNIVKKQVQEGVAALTREAFRSFFEAGADFRHGLQLSFASGNAGFLCAEAGLCVSDEGALKEMFSVKGAAGTLLCLLCRTTVSLGSDLHHNAEQLVAHTETDYSKWRLHSDASLLANMRHLVGQESVQNKGQFKALQQRLGLNVSHLGMLNTDTNAVFGFSITKGIMYDWMHCYVVSGLYHIEESRMLHRKQFLVLMHVTAHHVYICIYFL